MIEVVDTTTPEGVTADVAARVQRAIRGRLQPRTAYLVAHAALSNLFASPACGIPVANQCWWRCPCGSNGGACPHAVLYGRVDGRPRIGFAPAVILDESVRAATPAELEAGDPSHLASILVISVGNVLDIDQAVEGLDADGRPGLATLLMVWFELGLRDTLIAALGRVEGSTS